MAAGSPRGGLVRRALTGRSVPGLLLGWVAFLISLSPSLLPRPWHLQAVASAGSAVVAYAAGTLLAALCTPVFAALGVRVLVDPQRRRRAAITAIVVIVVGTLTAWVASMPRPRMPRSTSRRLRQPWCGSWSARARSSGRCSPS